MILLNFIINGNDARYEYLRDYLIKKGHHMACPADVLILSPKTDAVEYRKMASPNALVWGSLTCEETLSRMNMRKIHQSDAFRRKNSQLTAEGALCLAIEHTPMGIAGSKVLILGYGFLGKACAKAFSCLEACITVCSSDCRELRLAASHHYNVQNLHLLSCLDYDLIINTIPCPVLDNSLIDTIPKGTVLLELASTPCCDTKVFHKVLINGNNLPGRFSPVSAAMLIYEELLLHIGKENEYGNS